jgi:hypothetical protein
LFDEGSYGRANSEERAWIRELICFERYCRDYELWEEMGTLFLRDSRVRISWFDGTGAEFVEASKKMPGASHKIHNIVVKISGRKAVAEMVSEIQSRMEIGGADCDLVSHVRLFYRLLKSDDGWKILSIDCLYIKDSILPALPMSNPDWSRAEFAVFRPSYRCLCFFLAKMGKEINDELPGEDRPETIAAIYAEYGVWLST